MYCMDYVHSFQRNRFEFFLGSKFEYVDRLSFISVKDGYILPFKNSGWPAKGGVLSKSMQFQVESSMKRHKDCATMGGAYDFDKNKIEYKKGTYIYLGHIVRHWGHFLIDSITRLYFAYEHQDLKCIFIWELDDTYFKFSPQQIRFFELSGVDPKRIEFIYQPVQCEEILIPEQAYISNFYYSKQYLDMFARAADAIEPTITNTPKKVVSHKIS